MSDQAPGNDPLGERLQATFRAEHADIERRHLASASTRGRSRSWMWIPFTAAIAVVVVAIGIFLSNGGDDQADTTLQPTPLPTPQPSVVISPSPIDQAAGQICLSGEIRVFALDDADPVWSGVGPKTAWVTGSAVASPESSGANPLLEVSLIGDDGRPVIGFINPTDVPFNMDSCVSAGGDNLSEQPCTRVPGPARATGFEADGVSRQSEAGDPRSEADHIHDLQAQSNQDCTRLVVEFGISANESDGAATLLPPVLVRHESESITITATDRPFESAFGDPDRVDYEGGIGVLTLSLGYEFSVEFLHRDMEPHVRFMQDPARVVIDLFPSESPDPASPEPFGQNFVLRQPIQFDLTGQGIPVGTDIVVAGFGRPFEAQGLYRIWTVPPDVDPGVFLADPPAPLIEDVLRTSGWAEAWGSFSIELPALEPGTYIAVFGELPPTDEIGFYGAGQLFRIAETSRDDPAPFPEAQLLPDVQLPPESFD